MGINSKASVQMAIRVGSATGRPYQKAVYARTAQQLRRFHKTMLRYAKRLRSKLRDSGTLGCPGSENSDADRDLGILLKRVIPVLHEASQSGIIREHRDQLYVDQLIRRREGGE